MAANYDPFINFILFPRGFPPLYPVDGKSDGRQIKASAEDLHTFLFQSSVNIASLEKSFLSLAILMQMGECHILSKNEEKKAVEEILSIRERLDGGALKAIHAADALIDIIQHINEENPKARIVTIIVELEHILCVSKKRTVSSDEFIAVLSPFFRLLEKSLSSIESTIIYKDLEKIKQFIEHNTSKGHQALQELELLGKKLENKISFK